MSVSHFYAFQIIWSLTGSASCEDYNANPGFYNDPHWVQVSTPGTPYWFNWTTGSEVKLNPDDGHLYAETQYISGPMLGSMYCERGGRYAIFTATVGGLELEKDWTDDDVNQKF